MSNEIDWLVIGDDLRAPFDPADVDFRVQGKPGKSGKVQVVCYVDARVVADRLDDTVGPGAWSFTWQAIHLERGEVQLAQGTLAIHGVSKQDIGDGSTFATSKGCVSDALKRAAVLWGVGRYLYDIEREWVMPDQYGGISEADIKRMRSKLPRPDGMPPAPVQQPFVNRPPVIHAPVNNGADESGDKRKQQLQKQNDTELAEQPWQFLADTEFRKALNLRNIRDVAAVSAFVASATHKLHEAVTYADRGLCLAAATSLEGLAGKR